jgi:Xaa-Pro aminopeptidase
VTGHEEPRIVPYGDIPLAPGMVVMVEPGVYFPDETGIRLEHALLVTAGGAELLTGHDVSLP